MARTSRWITPQDIDASVIILVHGFTSHGRYMQELAGNIDGYGFCCMLFNYDSYLGIDVAARDLSSRLALVRNSLEGRGFVLVAHSMGGLVARFLARNLDASLRDMLKGVAMLGTPNQGTAYGNGLISFMLDWADELTGANPYARYPLCRSAQQLTLSDPERLVDHLNQADSKSPLPIPYLSISGGRPYLEMGKSNRPFAGGLRNRLLQKAIGGPPNDGLVPERSADISQVLGNGSIALHLNSYPEYSQLNHTYLASSQAVAGLVITWLISTVKLAGRRPHKLMADG